jgi:thiol-disulfide isomerase/thioredoxin
LSDYRGKPLVVAMTNAGCPICKKYAPTLAELHQELAEKGVALLLVNASGDTEKAMKDAVARFQFKARYVPDSKSTLASALGANSTGDCFLLDGARTLVYRGAVDDQYGLGYALDKPRLNYLRDAVAALLAGSLPYHRATWAPGCDLEFKPAAGTTTITWHNRVSRIIEQNCQECHRAGENGPFELMTYADVKQNAPTIKREVRKGTMPPWFASKEHGDWYNDRSLSERDKTDLIRWIDGGMPEGDAADAAAARAWPQGWRIGKPDDIVTIPREYKIPAKGTVPYQYSTIVTEFGEDRWVQAMEVRPTAPQAVHHVLIFLLYPMNHPRAKEQPDDRGGTRGYFMGMVPGQGHVVFPHGQGKFLPKGARMVFQIHYTTNGEEMVDRTSLGIIWCKERPATEIKTIGISNENFRIPPGADNHEVRAARKLTRAMRVESFMPHMHVRGKAYRYEVEYPDGRRETLLDIPRYDFNWQLLYILREPKDLPRGSILICTGWFDNSDKNPANPDPRAEVRFGEQTWDEMQIGYVNGYEIE